MSLDIAFLGGVFPKHLELEILEHSKGNIDFAANNLQWAIIDGLDICNHKPVHLCNVMFVRSYPKGYKKIIIKTEKFSHHPNSSDINLGFLNLFGLCMFFRFFAGTKGLLNWARKKNKNKLILIYSLHTPFLLAAIIMQAIYPGIKSCIVVPDLPSFMSDSKSFFYRLFKAVDKFIIDICLKRINAYVLLTDFMTERLNVGKRPWLRIEGIFNAKRYEFDHEKNNCKTIMYSGNLNISHGILDLLHAFSQISDANYRFWITGSGDGLNDILNASKKDKRIKYWPKLKQNELFKLLCQATLLVNPLKPDNFKTRYFFPSKTLEYMASGVPTLMYKLPCIPAEYNQYLHFFKVFTIDGIRNKIIEICEMAQEERLDFGKRAKDFVLNKKNPEAQCTEILNMLQKLFTE